MDESDDADQLKGFQIEYDSLTFDKKLNEGGYGVVYKGKWKKTAVAIKQIKREIIESDKLAEFKSKFPLSLSFR